MTIRTAVFAVLSWLPCAFSFISLNSLPSFGRLKLSENHGSVVRQNFRIQFQPNNSWQQLFYRCDDDSDEDNAGEQPDNRDDEEDSLVKPYGRRSLEWTKKYRSMIPYEKARQSVMDLGLRSKEEWDEYIADGKVYHGPYLPNRPDEMYADEWVSWEEFLGLMRPYEETRHIVRNVLKLSNMDDYSLFVHASPKRAEGLRIPALPQIVYKDEGWISFEHFFGTTTDNSKRKAEKE